MIQVPVFTPRKLEPTTVPKIPLKIFQTWKSLMVKPEIYQTILKLQEDNPEYEYHFYGDEECKTYLLTYYGQEYVDAFNKIKPGAFKADFWRYAVLAREGGVYIDLDIVLEKPLREIINPDTELYIIKDKGWWSNGIYQAFLACVPGQPVLVKTLQQCLYNLKTESMGNYISTMSITGPIMMGNVYNQYYQKPIKTHIFAYDRSTQLSFNNSDGSVKTNGGDIVLRTKSAAYDPVNSYAALYRTCSVYHGQARLPCLWKLYGVPLIIIILLIVVGVFIYRRVKENMSIGK